MTQSLFHQANFKFIVTQASVLKTPFKITSLFERAFLG
ncbi:hypothetical protein HPHPH43_1457 [Helicobacter pylori Hp H-43]|nr:hypothetical protein HPHPH43_1457 [Helicobacter pylori Hp H-43]